MQVSAQQQNENEGQVADPMEEAGGHTPGIKSRKKKKCVSLFMNQSMIFTFVCNKACRHGRDMQRHENFKSWAPQSVPGAQRLASPPGIHTQ